ncbi:hypothetical protein, partial [Enterobacter roggenkampii]|uniref:hypothetical protein n=1 Tax=Enterobacter roggenkampii TaxID=1812935 RepID=UPI0024B5A10E
LLKQRLAEQEALNRALLEKLADREREIDHLCSAAKFFAPKRIKLCTAARERKTAFAHGAN